GAVGIEPRDLVKILGRHHLEEIAGDRLGELLRARKPRRLDPGHRRYAVAIALRIGFVLIADEIFGAPVDDFLQALRQPPRLASRAQRPRDALDAGEIMGGAPSPEEGLLVHLD